MNYFNSEMTTWKKLIDQEMTKHNSDDSIIYNNLPNNLLDVPFDLYNHEMTNDHFFMAWSNFRVFFPTQDDAFIISVLSVPRNPCDEKFLLQGF